MKNGSKRTPRPPSKGRAPASTGSKDIPVKEDGSIDLARVPRERGPGKDGAALQNHPRLKDRNERQGSMDPIPPEAGQDPVAWAEKHLESLAPDAAKEVEWALKFGSDSMRYVAARDALAMKGVTTKPKENQITQQAMVFNFSGPVSQSGAPILPFSNAAPTLPAKLDTVETAPTLQSATNETEPKK